MERATDAPKEADDTISPRVSRTMSDAAKVDKSGNQIVEQSTLADDVEKQSDTESLQAGVQRAEILRKGWTKKGLYTAFVGYVRGREHYGITLSVLTRTLVQSVHRNTRNQLWRLLHPGLCPVHH